MSKADYRRPSASQVEQVARCSTCGLERTYAFDQAVDGSACPCGGRLTVVGESYPANADDWDEERDAVDGPWRSRR